MLTLLRAYMCYPQDPKDEHRRECLLDIESGPPPRGRTPLDPLRARLKGWFISRPIECEPDCGLYADFFGHFDVAPSRDGKTVLVFYTAFQSEVNGVAIFDELAMPRDEEDDLARTPGVVKIYEHLFAERKSHPRIVRYLGSTVSGYRLERLYPGHLDYVSLDDLPDAHGSDVVLALYQRWALQILSALAFIQTRGIVTNAVMQGSFWLRSNLSIAFACLTNASSIDLNIRRGAVAYVPPITSPWSNRDGHTDPPYTEREVGHHKGDIFDWATLVFEWMTGRDDPLENARRDVLHTGVFTAAAAVAKSRLTEWPELEDNLLGPILLKAWRSEYGAADEALVEARQLLIESGRTLSSGIDDEIDGFEWERQFEVSKVQHGGKRLRLRGKSKEKDD